MPTETLNLITILEFEKTCWYRRTLEETDTEIQKMLWIEFEKVEKRIKQFVDTFKKTA